MGDSNTQTICRLCLEKRLVCECENIDELKKKLLEILLINITLHISEYAIACSRCLEKIRDSFDFNSHNSTTFVMADIKSNVWQVCTLCMSLIEDKDFKYITELRPRVSLKDVITDCLSEMDLNTARIASICKLCLSGIVCYYRFMKSCKKVELLSQLTGHATEAIDNLEAMEMLESKQCNELGKGIIKSECLANVKSEIMEVVEVKNEGIASIKCEEVNIKDELDSGFMNVCQLAQRHGTDMAMDNLEEMLESKSCNEFGKGIIKSGCLANVNSEVMEVTDVKKERIASIKFEEVYIKDELDGGQSSNETMKFQCHYCEYKSNRKNSLNRHISAIHERETATVYYCERCTYETIDYRNWCKHSKRHGEKVTNRTHKCPGCQKGFVEKQNLDQHLLRKHDNLHHLITSRINYCASCTYKTTITADLTRHVAIQHDQKNAERFHCHNCSYFALSKGSLKRHVLIHSDFKPHPCPSCKKGFNAKGSLDSHILNKHKERADLLDTITRKIHRCALCEFQTVHKNHISRHITRNHKEMTGGRPFK